VDSTDSTRDNQPGDGRKALTWLLFLALGRILMALQSQLFRGDPKLEAAAVSDPAHLLPGASGPHVAKIQQALILIDRAAIAPDGAYGQATAAAVSEFKEKRQILNLQSQIDNIVGKKTMAALDSEMLALEARGGGGGLQLGFSVNIPEDNAKVPAGLFWGVDTFNPITAATIASVIKLFGRPPDYWGRYTAAGRSSLLRDDEIPLLRKNSPGTRLVLIHNPLGPGFFHDRKFGVGNNGNQTIVGFIRNQEKERQRGIQAALAAKSSAQGALQKAGIKLENVLIYMNIEPDQEFPRIGRVSPDFIRGWWEVMELDFGGLYGNVSEANQQAEAHGTGNVAFIGNAYNDARGGTGRSPFLWGQFPKRSRNFPVPQQYAPNQPPGSSNTVRIWQYGPTLDKTSFDMNLANQEGFDKMVKL
jgi:hypothetical protein